MLIRKNLQQYQKGISLSELLIAMAIGLILLSGILGLSANIIKNSIDTVKYDRLNYSLQQALDMMVTDIRRAGYWGNASSALGTSTNPNPFMAAATNITTNASGNCILFTYDSNADGTLSTSATANANEHFGYRLNNGAIQSLTSDADYSCTSTASSWENITDPGIINITNLNFVLTAIPASVTGLPGGSTITVREVTITITGSFVSDATVTKTVTESVRVANDLYTP